MTETAEHPDPPGCYVHTEVRKGVCTVTLDRPERRNAWSVEMEVQYFDALDIAMADDRVRALVVTATGRHFCTGLDVERLDAKARGVPAPERSRPVTYPLTIDKPIVAAINGTVAGIGLVQAALCDIRFAAAGTGPRRSPVAGSSPNTCFPGCFLAWWATVMRATSSCRDGCSRPRRHCRWAS